MGKRYDLISEYSNRFHRVISHSEYKEVRSNSRMYFTESLLRNALEFSDCLNDNFSVDFDVCSKGKDNTAYIRLRVMDKLRTQRIAVFKITPTCSYTGLLIKMKDVRTDAVFTENYYDSDDERAVYEYFRDRLLSAHKPTINPAKLKGWEVAKTNNYIITVSKPTELTEVVNEITGNKYKVKSNVIEPDSRCLLVKGILNEQWLDYPQRLCDEYTQVDGSELTISYLIDYFKVATTSLEIRRKADMEYGYLIVPEMATNGIIRTYLGDIIYLNNIKDGAPNVIIVPIENGNANWGRIEVVDYRIYKEMFKE